MKQAVILVAIAAMVACANAQAQEQSLSDLDAAAAIAAGAREKTRRHGLVLAEATPFRLEAFTPTTWIRQLAADFAREDHVLTANNLPLDARDPVLRLVVQPARSVEHVVLRNKTKTIVIRPLTEERVGDDRLRATFALDALRALRGRQQRDAVLITVIDANGEKDVEVTSDQFDRLR
jgi:hypothetical protein